MQGVITGRDVLKNLPLIWREFGTRCAISALRAVLTGKKTTFRSITVDGSEIEFSDGFTDLHTRVYERTLAGDGFGIAEARPSIQLVHDLRKAPLSKAEGDGHPMVAGARGAP